MFGCIVDWCGEQGIPPTETANVKNLTRHNQDHAIKPNLATFASNPRFVNYVEKKRTLVKHGGGNVDGFWGPLSLQIRGRRVAACDFLVRTIVGASSWQFIRFIYFFLALLLQCCRRFRFLWDISNQRLRMLRIPFGILFWWLHRLYKCHIDINNLFCALGASSVAWRMMGSYLGLCGKCDISHSELVGKSPRTSSINLSTCSALRVTAIVPKTN